MDPRFKALLKGLKVPDAEWWNKQPIEVIQELGACISEKAEGVAVEQIDAANRLDKMTANEG